VVVAERRRLGLGQGFLQLGGELFESHALDPWEFSPIFQ
jgi:hypothetical protein